MKAWRLLLTVIDKNNRNRKIIDFPVPADCRNDNKEKKKSEKSQDLTKKLHKISNVRVHAIPLFVYSLDVIPKQFGERLKDIGATTEIRQL